MFLLPPLPRTPKVTVSHFCFVESVVVSFSLLMFSLLPSSVFRFPFCSQTSNSHPSLNSTLPRISLIITTTQPKNHPQSRTSYLILPRLCSYLLARLARLPLRSSQSHSHPLHHFHTPVYGLYQYSLPTPPVPTFVVFILPFVFCFEGRGWLFFLFF